jgi:hypothetical protein
MFERRGLRRLIIYGMTRPEPATIYQLKVSLLGSKPPIWRRLVVPGDLWLDDLHAVIQIAMPWTNSHLHQFVVKSDKPKLTREQVDKLRRRGIWPDPESISGLRTLSDPAFELEYAGDETSIRLDALAPERRTKFVYEYDMGDSWQHQILVEKITEPDPGTTCSPHCLDGERACPPEDCGGIWGYYEMLDAIADEGHEQHEDMLEWLGIDDPADFDAKYFDVDAANRALGKLKLRGGR